jgi:hypothetical protein
MTISIGVAPLFAGRRVRQRSAQSRLAHPLEERARAQVLLDAGVGGRCTVEQDCDPTPEVRPIDD